MNDARSALVLFSDSQDSTTCQPWVLQQFAHVETIAFDCRQRHRIELDQRLVVLDELRRRLPQWANRLGEELGGKVLVGIILQHRHSCYGSERGFETWPTSVS